MNPIDKEYLDLLRDIMVNGKKKQTRAGEVLSVFGRQTHYSLKNAIPLLTTKKVYTHGGIVELLWFLQHPSNTNGGMNIKYLIDNKTHIWDMDAYRWFKEWVTKNIPEQSTGRLRYYTVVGGDDELGQPITFYTCQKFQTYTKDMFLEMGVEEFLDSVKERHEIWVSQSDGGHLKYRFGDLGPVYGTQWRSFGESKFDQIQNIIDTLKTNPNDRRMLCMAYNPDVLHKVALPPCHVMMQFYTRPLSNEEREYEWHHRNPGKEFDGNLDGIPTLGLSCMYTMRSNDYFLGKCWNDYEYGVLTYMIAKLVNMVPDELVASIGDCHLYLNHYDAATEQLKRKGSETLPKLVIHGNQTSIDDFKIEDFEIVDYYPDPPIKAPLSVGL